MNVPIATPQPRNLRTLLLATQLYGSHGGVPAFGQMVAEILSEYAITNAGVVDLVSFVDDHRDVATHAEGSLCGSFAGARSSKVRFLTGALRVTIPGCRTAIVMHIALAPVALALKRLRRIRSYVLVLHGIEAWRQPSRIHALAARHALRIIATTSHTAEVFRRNTGIPADRFAVIPLAMSRRELPPPVTRSAAGQRNGLKILTVGRQSAMERYKGTDHLIAAVAKLRSMNVQAELVVVGTGDDLERLRSLVAEHRVSDYVRFLGAVSNEALADQYGRCDVFAMPSKGEGFGIAFLEAMSYGKPCIGGGHGGTPEVISDGETGFLVEHGALEELTERLYLLSQDDTLRTRLGANAREAVRTRYLYTHMRDAWFEMLDAMHR